ncbi:hypothetical protein K2173_017999 [Erythroxylum novogranatense]|uniref:Uncharacterized protein n=1 Tax=Erythroxylum novogranatense TaxID=1862640 RepID=A0AAV8TXU1_9ROSI|nr:hypothetical protein K2173_017999 [Erythroxylum novogranatense]
MLATCYIFLKVWVFLSLLFHECIGDFVGLLISVILISVAQFCDFLLLRLLLGLGRIDGGGSRSEKDQNVALSKQGATKLVYAPEPFDVVRVL